MLELVGASSKEQRKIERGAWWMLAGLWAAGVTLTLVLVGLLVFVAKFVELMQAAH